ncbi:hypothetical protein JHN59_13085 [Streptomyces sp. MBT49]|uniref:hypothetical protein n=1 Tax=Streptomyces sp. MBT49 TaxID=1488380 RepID=UPI00190A11E3|nr:hypothetical protein [Streptomyces sp. MBT49]MBK3625759.1 hypothetical protein [Streptomyces sp. MBT49]
MGLQSRDDRGRDGGTEAGGPLELHLPALASPGSDLPATVWLPAIGPAVTFGHIAALDLAGEL